MTTLPCARRWSGSFARWATTCATLKSAEDFLASNDLGQFACAITDIQMPGMNGFELKHELSARHPSLPVIMITARTEPGTEEKAMSSGATYFLRKPFEAGILVNCLQRVLSDV